MPAGALTVLAERRFGRHRRPAAVAAVELERAVDELLHRRMLRRTRDGYAFVTPLLREAAYAGIGKADLAERHAYLARWAAGWRGPGCPQADVDVFVADHVERAAVLAELVGLRPDADPRLVVPLGVGALGRGRAAGDRRWGTRAQAVRVRRAGRQLAGGELHPSDRLVHARALLQTGCAAEALDLAEKVCANAGDDPVVRAGALLVAGRAHRTLGEPERAVRSWREALAVAAAAGLTGRAGRGAAPVRHGRLPRRAARGARPGGSTRRTRSPRQAGDRRSQGWSLHHLAWVATARGDFDGADQALGQAIRHLRRAARPVRSGVRLAARPPSPGSSPAG